MSQHLGTSTRCVDQAQSCSRRKRGRVCEDSLGLREGAMGGWARHRQRQRGLVGAKGLKKADSLAWREGGTVGCRARDLHKVRERGVRTACVGARGQGGSGKTGTGQGHRTRARARARARPRARAQGQGTRVRASQVQGQGQGQIQGQGHPLGSGSGSGPAGSERARAGPGPGPGPGPGRSQRTGGEGPGVSRGRPKGVSMQEPISFGLCLPGG